MEEAELVVDRRRMSWFRRNSSTFMASMPSCGISDPGIAPSDTSRSRISATRIEVSWRQNQRAQPITPSEGRFGASSAGAVDSWEPAAPRFCSSSVVGVLPVVVLLIGQIPTVKPLDQVCMSCTMLSHAPVSSSTPVAIIMAPPIRITQT
ncbi:hypothetical protein SVIOM342S_05749 [Streptomyces violaceorubidus]